MRGRRSSRALFYGLLGAMALAALGACSRSVRESPSSRSAASADSAAPAPPASALASAPGPACGDAGDVFVFVSPEHPVRGQTLRVVAITDHAIDGRLTVTSTAGSTTSADDRHGGPPYFFIDRVDVPLAGKWSATVARSAACGGAVLGTKAFVVRDRAPAATDSPPSALWLTRAAWSTSFENL
jgi:hypothetical protein